MKKIITILLFSVTAYSQDNLQIILKKIGENSGYSKEIYLKKDNIQKYKQQNKFADIIQDKVVEIYKTNNKSSDFYLYYLNSFDQFSLYAIGDKSDREMDLNEAKSTGPADFILFDKKNNTILYVELSSMLSSIDELGSIDMGSIYKNKKDTIKVDYSTAHLYSKIIRLDDKLMPVSSIEYDENIDGSNKFKLSFYDKGSKGTEKRTKYISYNSNDTFTIPMDELYHLLKNKPESFDIDKECDGPYCDSHISKLIF